mmetsp:Transcript_13352/g.27127  ORF Transcript_13352/g.27127 Transcript_13352/m.27127 type:complete len:84 (-) Transcript_13352:1502-1753(-)
MKSTPSAQDSAGDERKRCVMFGQITLKQAINFFIWKNLFFFSEFKPTEKHDSPQQCEGVACFAKEIPVHTGCIGDWCHWIRWI